MEKRYHNIIEQFNHHLSPSDLERALTHYSWHGEEKERGNARYVLAGRHVFKGEVARLLIKYYPAHGAKLEHVLGNLFKDKYLNRLWDAFGLAPLVRHGDSIPVEELKISFVYAFLGCLALHLPYDDLREFIRTRILGNVEHLFAEPKERDFRALTDAAARKLHGCATGMTVDRGESGEWLCIVTLAGKELARGESASRKYAMRKAYKGALRLLDGVDASDESGYSA